ncbi:MAG TPA: ACP S-malonyltransferase [Candidatus Sulfotelmatobacter sp.]|nr:ACP S-malonyltransferase [Candidatus Sulfotelmatobacter sp.]
MTRAFIFPGQGSQAVGMGQELAKAFASARLVFEEVDDALGQRLSRVIFEGPEADLTLTENAQPALMAVSLAVVRTLAIEVGRPLDSLVRFVAGHSLGEYSALAAAGALSLADAARLLKRRGRAMQQAVPVGEGAMAALLGAELAAARELVKDAAEGEVCDVANDNGGGQVVISGATAAVERAIKLAPTRGIRRAVTLPVSAPFHSALMKPAADVMAEALATTALAVPSVPLIANVTAEPVSDPDAIRRQLVEQVVGMVRWRECIERLVGLGVDGFVEIGAGKVLSGLVRRIARDAKVGAIGVPAELESFVKEL